MRLAWTSDIHLNHAALPAWDEWAAELSRSKPDGIVLTGDISESDDVIFQLRRLAEAMSVPIYFVLGNHDFYGASIASTRRIVSAVARELSTLIYLSDSDAVELQPGTYLIGEDGWGDATVGDYDGSPVRLNDFSQIKDFRRVDPISWPRLLHEQGEDSASRLRRKLNGLPKHAERIWVATHVPPFRESCWYEGKTTDDFWAPFFVCGQVGQVIKEYSSENPKVQITVLCGHTHHPGTAQIAPNLIVHTAGAEYGKPAVQQLIEI